MSNKRSILLKVLEIVLGLGSGIVALLSIDEKNKALDRKVNAAVDKKITEIQKQNSTEIKEA